MDQTQLKAQVRTRTGKGSARTARRAGLIPAVVYSHFSEAAAIAVDPSALRKAVKGSDFGFNTVLHLELDDGGKKTALLKDWQVHPVNHRLLHADFIEIKMDEALDAEVPVVLKGKAKGVIEGGLLNQVRREVTVRCLPEHIPATVEVDISSLGIGEVLHVADLTLPENVKAVFAHNYTIAVITGGDSKAEAA